MIPKLNEGLQKLGLGKLGPGENEKSGEKPEHYLERYIEEIELFNPAYGLVKVKDREELVIKHILDSLAPLEIIKNLEVKSTTGKSGKSIADVGSGAGLPGIPLAICLPEANFTLIERMGRRVGFLQNTLAVLSLKNVNIMESEMEKIPEPCRFDIIVSRAFKPLSKEIISAFLKLLNPGGFIAAYKGRRESINEELSLSFSAAEKNNELIGVKTDVKIYPLEVPFLNEERHLVLISIT